MREHQIVISLKPEQFEEVQRMARAAGSKSISAFLRQKLVATLSLGQNSEFAEPVAAGPDLKQLTGELRRLHRELQIFVADSLMNSDYSVSVASVENAIPFPTAVQENFLTEGAPLLAESAALNYREVEQSLLNDGTSPAPIPIMPSNPMLPGQVSSALERGSVFGTSSFSIPTSSGFEELAEVDRSAYDVARTFIKPESESFPGHQMQVQVQRESAAQPAQPAAATNVVQPAYELPPSPGQAPYAIPPSNPDYPEAFRASSDGQPSMAQAAYSIPEAPPEPIAKPQKTVQSFAENDELEELADRAFAISPRLGPFNEAVKRFPDPLQDLLEEDLFSENDADDATAAAMSAAPQVEASEREQLEEVIEDPADELLEEVIEDPADETIAPNDFEASFVQTSNETDVSTQHPLPDNSSQLNEEEEVDDAVTDTGEPSDGLSHAIDDDSTQTSDDTPPSAPPQPPPQISGGPPPRKRRT